LQRARFRLNGSPRRRGGASNASSEPRFMQRLI